MSNEPEVDEKIPEEEPEENISDFFPLLRTLAKREQHREEIRQKVEARRQEKENPESEPSQVFQIEEPEWAKNLREQFSGISETWETIKNLLPGQPENLTEKPPETPNLSAPKRGRLRGRF